MKILRVLLWIFGVANIPVGIITMANAPAEFVGQGISQFVLGIAFCGGAIYCTQRIKAKKQEAEEYEKWQKKISDVLV
ncbi:hypothetical protein [Alistipes shahii]|jgi:hypothetical protein|uniref:hypothetical protein n=1 Tax=Alistipes shahii TaxID=328814 RepID=UPI00189DB45B|nr:hypothetical protein [Alistipes shahii]